MIIIMTMTMTMMMTMMMTMTMTMIVMIITLIIYRGKKAGQSVNKSWRLVLICDRHTIIYKILTWKTAVYKYNLGHSIDTLVDSRSTNSWSSSWSTVGWQLTEFQSMHMSWLTLSWVRLSADCWSSVHQVGCQLRVLIKGINQHLTSDLT